jgi:hypothetical protein
MLVPPLFENADLTPLASTRVYEIPFALPFAALLSQPHNRRLPPNSPGPAPPPRRIVALHLKIPRNLIALRACGALPQFATRVSR